MLSIRPVSKDGAYFDTGAKSITFYDKTIGTMGLSVKVTDKEQVKDTLKLAEWLITELKKR